MVIYRHYMVLLSLLMLYNISNAVNTIEWQLITLIKSFITSAQGGKHKYHGNLPQHFNPRIIRVKITMVIYRNIVL
jgi:hypothetical protein